MPNLQVALKSSTNTRQTEALLNRNRLWENPFPAPKHFQLLAKAVWHLFLQESPFSSKVSQHCRRQGKQVLLKTLLSGPLLSLP